MSKKMDAFTKWRRVVTHHHEEQQQTDDKAKDWQVFLDRLQGTPAKEQLQAVNRWVNQLPYRVDLENWDEEDHWATPMEFLNRGAGDCEDFAIAKFMALKSLGFTNEQMRIVVLNDTMINELHAILVVELDGEAMVLDNYIKQIVTAERIHHYQPIYSINETAWWRH